MTPPPSPAKAAITTHEPDQGPLEARQQQGEHRQRCETCTNHEISGAEDSCPGEDVCGKTGCTISPAIMSWIDIHGCASHSTPAPASEPDKFLKTRSENKPDQIIEYLRTGRAFIIYDYELGHVCDCAKDCSEYEDNEEAIRYRMLGLFKEQYDRTIREDERLKENARVLEKLNNRKILYSTQYVSMSIEMCEMGKIRIEEIEGIIESLRLPQPSASEATTTTTEQQQVKR